MTDGLRKSHLRKAPQVGLSEVGLPDIYHCSVCIVYTQTNPHYHCGYGVVNAIYLQTLLGTGRRCQDRYLPIVISNQTTTEY